MMLRSSAGSFVQNGDEIELVDAEESSAFFLVVCSVFKRFELVASEPLGFKRSPPTVDRLESVVLVDFFLRLPIV